MKRYFTYHISVIGDGYCWIRLTPICRAVTEVEHLCYSLIACSHVACSIKGEWNVVLESLGRVDTVAEGFDACCAIDARCVDGRGVYSGIDTFEKAGVTHIGYFIGLGGEKGWVGLEKERKTQER